MIPPNVLMLQASIEVRAIANQLLAAMREIETPHGWSGADADQFENQWHDLVTARLLAAANKLDGLSWSEIRDALDG